MEVTSRFSYTPDALHPCGRCEVCREYAVRERFHSLSERMLSPVVHDYAAFTLSLPKWPDVLPVVDNCKSVGELLYWTPELVNLEMKDILRDMKAMAFGCVESCFPGCRVGVGLFLHFTNDFLQFSPHFHGVLCATGLDASYWPLKRVKGEFPKMGDAWRKVLGQGKRSLRDFRSELHERWADGLGSFYENILTKCHVSMLPGMDTTNIGYRLLQRHPDVVKDIGSVIAEAVRDDDRCLKVEWMKRDRVTGEEDPEGVFGKVLRYGLSGSMKSTEFRGLGGRMFSVVFRQNGRIRSCGDRPLLYRRLAQLHYASQGVRRYQVKGLFGAALGGRGKAYGRAFVEAMNRGYPRPKER